MAFHVALECFFFFVGVHYNSNKSGSIAEVGVAQQQVNGMYVSIEVQL